MDTPNNSFDTDERFQREVRDVLHKAAHKEKFTQGYDGTTKTTSDFANQAMVHVLERNPALMRRGQKCDRELRSYLWAVVRNVVRDQNERDRANKRPPRAFAVPLDSVALPCDYEGIEHQVIQRESEARLRELLEQFERGVVPNFKKENQRRLARVFLQFLDGQTQQEIANDCNIHRTQVSREIETIATYLRQQLDDSRRNSR